MEEALIGRDHVARYFEAYERSHPDMIFVIRNSRVVTDPDGRAIKYKFFWTGTNIAPLSNNMVYNPQNKLTKYLDNALVRKKELASIKSLANKVKATGQVGVARTAASMRTTACATSLSNTYRIPPAGSRTCRWATAPDA